MQDESRDIALRDILEPRLMLRLVDRDSVEYLELRDSIAAKGFINSVCVRPLGAKYEIVDGLYRYNCAIDLHLVTIPCIVKHGQTDDDVLALQIQANAIRPETTPTEFARQLKKIMAHRPGIAMAELAHLVHKSPTWVKNTLGLLSLHGYLQRAVDRGEIALCNAYMLAKLPVKFRVEFVDRAKTLPVNEFKAAVAAVIKRFSEAIRQGKLEAMFTSEFVPTAYLRLLREVQQEYELQECGGLHLAAANCTSPVEAWYLALQWVMHLDPASIDQQKHAAQLREHRDFQSTSEEPDEIT
jgi:ParB/RepB/Spo0J family partition protein